MGSMVPAMASQAPQEDVLFQTADGSVWVTPTRAGLRGKTYQLSLVTMVKADRVPAKRTWAIAFLVVGVLFMLMGFSGGSPGAGGFGLLLAAIGGIGLAMIKDTHRVVFANASGQDTAAYESKSPHDVARIVESINEAMARRGASYGHATPQGTPQPWQGA